MRDRAAILALLAPATLAGIAAVAPVWSDPGALAPASRFTDGHLLGLSLWGESIARGELPSLTTEIVGWPAPSGLRPLLWPGALLAAAIGPVWTVCLLYALTPAFNAACGWALGAALGRGVAGRFVLGALLAFHPWVIETLANGQVEQAVIGGAALQLAATIVALRLVDPTRSLRERALGRVSRARRQSWVAWVLPGVVTALVGWAAPHVALVGCLLSGFWAVLGIVGIGGGLLRRGLVLAATAAGALAVQAYHGPAFGPGQHVFAPKGSADRPTFVADVPEVATIRGLFVPPANVRTANALAGAGGPGGGAPVVHPSWLGFVLLGAAGLAVVRRAKGVALPLGAAVGFAVLALGPTVWIGGVALAMPWRLLGVVAPTIGASMSAYRMLMGAVIALAIAASAAFPSVRSGAGGPPPATPPSPDRRSGRRAAIVGALAVAALFEATSASTRPLPLAAQAAPRDGSVDALAGGDGPVLDLPLVGPECPGAEGHYLLQAALSDRPVPLLLAKPRAAYGRLPGLLPTFAGAWSSARCAERVREALAELPFTAVVLHTHDADCPPPKRTRSCLDAALGPGTEGTGTVWWPVTALR